MKAIGSLLSEAVTSAPRKGHAAVIERVDSGQNLDQRRFASSVLAEEGQDFPRVQIAGRRR